MGRGWILHCWVDRGIHFEGAANLFIQLARCLWVFLSSSRCFEVKPFYPFARVLCLVISSSCSTYFYSSWQPDRLDRTCAGTRNELLLLVLLVELFFQVILI